MLRRIATGTFSGLGSNMARAFPVSQTSDFSPPSETNDWQALRGELVALLDHVEGQYAQAGAVTDPAFAGFAQRVRDLRYQVGDDNPADRHREALRTVKRQMERFTDREPEPVSHADDVLQSAIRQIRARTQPPQRDGIAPEAAPSPAAASRFEDLANTMTGMSARLGQFEAELKTQRGNAAQVKEIADQVAQLSQVMELLAGAVGETGQVKQLESQIADLTQLMAQGPKVDLTQVNRRLDSLASTVERLADLQVEHIHHEVREAEAIPQRDAEAARSMQSIEASVRNIYDRIDGLEQNVRLPAGELDRISDAVAQIAARIGTDQVRPDRLLALVDALNGRISELEDKSEALVGLKGDIGALRDAVLGAIEPRFSALETRIDSLGNRLGEERAEVPGIGQLEAQVRLLVARMDQTGEQLAGLAQLYGREERQPLPDFEALANLAAARTFEAISRHQPAAPDFDALADMVAARTSAAMARVPSAPAPDLEALADLAAERTSSAMARKAAPAPDLEHLANLVADRTSTAFARQQPMSERSSTLSESGLAEIEARISRLVEGFARARGGQEFSGVQDGIRQVDERLARLEAVLCRPAPAAAMPVMPTAPAAPMVPHAAEIVSASPAVALPPAPVDTAPAPIAPAPLPARAAATVSAPIAPERDDAMPRNPAADAPLKEFGFPDLGPVRAALEAKNGPRKPAPGISKADLELQQRLETQPIVPEMAAGRAPRRVEPAAAGTGIPAFDPATVVRPPRPASSLEARSDDVFGPAPEAATTMPQAEPSDAVANRSRNTFIEAARRAAQRQNPPVASSNSLIGKAMSRFQPGTIAGKPAAPEFAAATAPAMPSRVAVSEPVPAPPIARSKAGKLLGRGPKMESALAASQMPPASIESAIMVDPIDGPHEAPVEGFLLRHRKAILLGASLIAIAFMAANLVMQRIDATDAEQGDDGVLMTAPAPATDAAKPAAAVPAKPAPATDAAKPANAPAPTAPAAAPAPTKVSIVAPGPRVIPLSDTFTTGSIGAAPALGYAAGESVMPPALAAATTTATAAPAAVVPDAVATATLAPAPIASPVKVEMPPEAVGPLDLRQKAADGDARAQFEIAAIYSEGRAVPEDFKAAASWYERAAAQSFAPAQYRLGNLYEIGKGVTKDFEQAKLWYQRAAEDGNRMAMHNLAALYAGGQFGKQDFASAAEWFERAANLGMKDSQFNLGMLYARGLGVPQNLETSYKWFALAATGGDTDAGKARDNMARSLDAEAVKRAAASVDAWKPTQIDLVANFAPIGTWAANFNPGAAITSKDVVTKVQTALARLGYDIGTPDGHVGPKTAIAIRAFERGTGMSEVGAINPRLLAVLGSQPV